MENSIKESANYILNEDNVICNKSGSPIAVKKGKVRLTLAEKGKRKTFKVSDILLNNAKKASTDSGKLKEVLKDKATKETKEPKAANPTKRVPRKMSGSQKVRDAYDLDNDFDIKEFSEKNNVSLPRLKDILKKHKAKISKK
jgi:hypothetical protein